MYLALRQRIFWLKDSIDGLAWDTSQFQIKIIMPEIKCRDGSHLFYNLTGEGEPIVLIAGGFCDHHVWDDLINFLNPHFQVITFDNRGIGKSSVAAKNYSVQLLTSDLNDLIDQLNLGFVHIVGHSMGGFIAQYFAAHYPQKILSLTLLSSLLVMNKTGINFLDILIKEIKSQPDKIRQTLPEKAGQSQNAKSIIQQAKLCKKHDARGYINKIQAPTLIISGHKEVVITEEESHRLASAIKNVNAKIFLNCDHMLPREKPQEVAKALLEFLGQVRFS